ncbi:hypothetical protein FPV67DRAFT_1455880 [Lyophyllum atratum]|nr:hypothetical protein FPV67DRAFT_1455880 [Lyophyllum atratum]
MYHVTCGRFRPVATGPGRLWQAGHFQATATAGFGNQPQPQPQVRLFAVAVRSFSGLFRLVQPDLESLKLASTFGIWGHTGYWRICQNVYDTVGHRFMFTDVVIEYMLTSAFQDVVIGYMSSQ